MFESKPFILAPMAEITTPALRKIIREFSDRTLMCSEMLSAGALVAGFKGNEVWAKKYEFDDPFIYQIMGNSPDVMSKACAMLSDKGCFSVDINMGCSSPFIMQKGVGAKLLEDIDSSKEIVKACRKATNTNLSVKMRSGFYENDEKYLIKFVKMLEGEGVDFITLHPRFAKISFSRSADWKLVKLVKENIKIPVIGNGDISDPAMALKRMRDSNCDGIMIGREAVKSPWIFSACEELIEKNQYSIELDLCDIFIKTLGNIKIFLPEHLHKSRGHRFCFYYSKNFKFSHEFYKGIHRNDSIDGMIEVIEAYFKRNPGESIKKFVYNTSN